MVCTGKETENMFMMPIDTGNKAIKTENFEFNSGITMLADVPGENEEALMYQGRYYRLSHERNVYLPDKTMDDRYYLLTLFAIAKELEEMSHSKSFIPGELISMDLVVGLPPLYYRGQGKMCRSLLLHQTKGMNLQEPVIISVGLLYRFLQLPQTVSTLWKYVRQIGLQVKFWMDIQ